MTFDQIFNATPQEGNTTFSIEIQKEEFKSVRAKVPMKPLAQVMKRIYKVIGKQKKVLGHCRLEYITVASLMGELCQTLCNRAGHRHCV